MKTIKFLNVNNEVAGGCRQKYFFDRYFKDINIKNSIKDSVENKINSDSSFIISIPDLKEIDRAIEEKIDLLLKHSDFNPFKIELREKYQYPQYGSYPLLYKGKTYYLYTKGGEFVIDIEIDKFYSFKKEIEKNISLNKSMDFIYKEF